MNGYKEIDAETLHDFMQQKKLTLVDVRNDDEVARGIIPGAIHISLSMLPVQYEALHVKEPVVLYCHSGIRSAQAAAFIASKGIEDVYNLRGGVLAWANAGFAFNKP